MFDRNKIREEFYNKFPDLRKIKENPNDYPIINKWNYNLFRRYQIDVFNYVESLMEEVR